MSVGPTMGERITNACIALGLGLFAFAGFVMLLILFWRQGRRGPLLLLFTGLAAISVGVCASSAVRLVGLTHGTDTSESELALALQFGGTAVAFVLWILALVTALVSQRRRTSVR